MPAAIELEAHHLAPVHAPESRCEARGDAVPVACLPRLPEAVPGPRRRVRDAGGRRRPGRQLVEAGERLVVAISIEDLVARQQAIASEDPEPEERSLIGTAAGAGGAEVSPPHE